MQGEEAANAAVRALREVLDENERNTARILSRMDTERGSSRLVSDSDAVANAREVSRQLRAAIEALQDDATSILRDAAVRAARDEAERLGFTFSPEAARAIEGIVANRQREIVEVFANAGDTVARAVRVATTTNADLGALLDEVSRELRTTVRRAQSAVDSAAMASGRQTTILDSQEAEDEGGQEFVFTYDGPWDAKTREFCRDHITSQTQRAYALSYLQRADNGGTQPKPVSLYLGGYNCRHLLSPITVENARSLGLEIVR
jgi:hypothetical protein